MLARAYILAARTYVDPFDRICHGLRSLAASATTDPKEVSGQFSRFVHGATALAQCSTLHSTDGNDAVAFENHRIPPQCNYPKTTRVHPLVARRQRVLGI